MYALSPISGIQVSSVYPTYTHIKGQCPKCVCVCVCVRACVRVCVRVCVAKPVRVELRCHATALIGYYTHFQIWCIKWDDMVVPLRNYEIVSLS